jgi:pyruvate dehydrogenase (quinone)
LQAAADVLNAGQRLAILVGAGALGATHEVIEVATCLGGGVAKALLGKAVVPDDLPSSPAPSACSAPNPAGT